MAKTERRQAIAPIIEDTTDEIRENSLQEAAELLGRSVVTVRRYVKNGTLEASKLGGKYIIPAAEVKKYL